MCRICTQCRPKAIVLTYIFFESFTRRHTRRPQLKGGGIIVGEQGGKGGKGILVPLCHRSQNRKGGKKITNT